jgi:2-methylcitrate dehydratase PrpD
MLVYREITPLQLDGQVLQDERLLRLMSKIEVVSTASIPGQLDNHSEGGVRVRIRLVNGDGFVGYSAAATGTPQVPMSDDQFHNKFLTCAASTTRKETAEILLKQLQQIELTGNITELRWS